ncbi:Nn.00g115380.m01.CDS01 [Neocucurbitaria sp. VM-36]
MADGDNVNSGMNGTQVLHPEVEHSKDESMTGDGEDEFQERDFPNDEEDDPDGENLIPAHTSLNAPTECQDTMTQDPEDQQDVRQSVEEHMAIEPGTSVQYEHDTTMFQDHDESQEHGGIPMGNIQYEQEDAVEHHDTNIQEPMNTMDHGDQRDFRQHTEDNPHDSSSLFVPEGASPSPETASRQGSSANMPPPPRPSVASRQPTPALSIFAQMRNLQKRHLERKNATTRPTVSHSTPNPDNEAYLQAVMSGITPTPSTPVPEVDEDEMADREAIAEFARTKRRYDDLKLNNGGRLSFRHDIEWMKIKNAEDARRKKRQRDIAKAQEGDEDEPNLFPQLHSAVNDDHEDDSDNGAFNFDIANLRKRPRQPPRKEPKQISMQDAELHSMQVALEAAGDRPRKKKKGDDSQDAVPSSARGRVSKSKSTKSSKAKAAPKKATKGPRKTAKSKRELDHAVKQATSLFNSNVFQQQAGAGASEQPTFRSRVKADALKELIASVPLEDQTKARGDMNVLLAATKEFDGKGSVKSDGAGHWLVKGMKTSLKGYQVLGTAFMRKRENASDEPKGGLMADQMGLGKTLMMLANIVNGRPAKGDQGPKTTLLVASPSLLTQWKNEIEQHTDCKFKIMRYGAGTRVDSNHAFNILAAHDIVLTTYTEIMKSYPKNEPPIECQTAEQKIDWWKETYDQQRGILHRGMFLRVVLDEAQAIKNHMGRTSIACRALIAQHKWALSGTPILNSLTELYPYFKFLGVPHTGSFKIFKHNYCDKGGTENAERLLVRLSQFMIRRTHADEMFGAPILKLPQADQTTYWCQFNSVERQIYEIVRIRFSRCINMWAQKGDLEKSYSNALVMLLRLRQLTAHVLMLQFVMRDLLEWEDIERIKRVVEGQVEDGGTQRGRTIIAIRKQLENLAADQKKKSAAEAAAKKGAKEAGRDAKVAGGDMKDDNLPVNEGDDDANDEDANNEDEAEDDAEEHTQQSSSHGGSGGQFGKEYNFKPFLNSLKTGESWEKAKKKAKCSSCKKQPWNPCMMSCGHLICSDPCMSNADVEAAEKSKQFADCKACGVAPLYCHPCDPEDMDYPEAVAQGTRSQSKKKKDKQRTKRDNEDIAEDWLASMGDDVLPSAKTIAVKAQIMNWTRENPGVKVIIYTQFLAMIRILARVCKQEKWQIEEYHGNLSLLARDKAISNFAKNPNVKVMLASLRCGGLGLNLTMASKVIMIDPWWNSASEQQAFCRVFRIGQKEETFMSRLCVKDTVDERLIQMQKRKQAEIEAVMDDDGSRVKRMGIRDLMRLFGNLQEDSDGTPYIMVDNPDPRGGFRADRDDEGYADEV